MTTSEYQSKVKELNTKYNSDLHNLCMEYVNTNKKYNIGDYLYNITGIIKVKSISYTKDRYDNIEITYSGYKYKKEKGVLVKNKLYNTNPETKTESLIKLLNL